MKVEVRRQGTDAIMEVRRMAEQRRCALRAPHHSVSSAGLVGELAIAAGGILLLDCVEEFRGSTLLTMKNHLDMMAEHVRPLLFLTHEGELPERVRQMFGIPDPEDPAAAREEARKERVYAALDRMRGAHEALCRAQEEAQDAMRGYDRLGDHVHAGGPRPGDCIRCGLAARLKGPAE